MNFCFKQSIYLNNENLSRNVCSVNEIKIVFNFVFVRLVEGWVGRVLYFSGRRCIVNGLVASLHLTLNPRLNYFVIVVTDW